MANYLIEQLSQQTQKQGHREFYRAKHLGKGEWQAHSWNDFFDQVNAAARALYKLGAQELDKVVVCGPNSPEILVTDYACFYNRMATVPVHAYISTAQFSYIAGACGARIVFAGNLGQYELARLHCDKHPGQYTHIVIISGEKPKYYADGVQVLTWDEFLALGADMSVDDAVNQRMLRATPQDMATLMYTSGTSGVPKGVILQHAQLEAQVRNHLELLHDLKEGELSLASLPMSHVFEKAWQFYCVSRGLRIAYCYDPNHMVEVIHDVQPNVMCCVPRFWEKIYEGVAASAASHPRFYRWKVKHSLTVGELRNIKYVSRGKKVPWLLERYYQYWKRTMYTNIRYKMGFSNTHLFPTAGAHLSDKIIHFFRAVEIQLIYGYGLTESVATVACFPDTGYVIGTVGRPLKGVEVRIDNSGEILLKGPTITPGYYNDPELNERSFTKDGYLRTGDQGFLDKEGNLVISARKKELFKTTTGEYIAPSVTEALLTSNRYIDEIAVIADNKKYVTALVVPNFGYLEKWARAKGLKYADREELSAMPVVQEHVLAQIQEAQKDLSEYEKIKKITLLTSSFSRERGEITNTFKLRRNVIAENYAPQIAAMYPDEGVYPGEHVMTNR